MKDPLNPRYGIGDLLVSHICNDAGEVIKKEVGWIETLFFVQMDELDVEWEWGWGWRYGIRWASAERLVYIWEIDVWPLRQAYIDIRDGKV